MNFSIVLFSFLILSAHGLSFVLDPHSTIEYFEVVRDKPKVVLSYEVISGTRGKLSTTVFPKLFFYGPFLWSLLSSWAWMAKPSTPSMLMRMSTSTDSILATKSFWSSQTAIPILWRFLSVSRLEPWLVLSTTRSIRPNSLLRVFAFCLLWPV